MHILVVDDSPTIRAIAEASLTELNHNVTVSEDAVDALELLHQYPIQLVILDWMMPGMDGIELASTIRQTFTDRYTYIIMLTAKDGINDMVVGLESGIDDFMIKPFDKRELSARIKIGERIINLENQLRDNLDLMNQSRQEWAATTEAIPQLICLLDADGNVIRSNGTLSGWQLARSDEITGRKLHNLLRRIFPEFATQIRQQWSEASLLLSKGHNFSFDGADTETYHFFHVQYEPIGNLIAAEHSFAAVSIQDVTEQKQLEIELISAKQQVEEEHDKSERLLLNILPARIAERLKQNEQTIAESFEEVSVLFADIVGFTALSRNTSPHQLVDILNTIFTRFDQLAVHHQLEKIKTIGDAYLVVGGLSVENPNHIDSIINMGLDMNQAISEVNELWHHNLSIRIGIDCGAVVAGVIGENKFIYDLWGDTVNTASRMESSGIKGYLQVTESIYQYRSTSFNFEHRGNIEVKGIGAINTYLLNSVDKKG
jgi:adenylate cyclase